MSQPDVDEQRAVETTVTALQAWADELDPVQRAKLFAARRRALSPAAPRRWQQPAWGGAALAASLALAIGFWPRPATPPTGPGIEAASMLDLELGDDEQKPLPEDLDSDLDLYLWLDGSDAAVTGPANAA